MNDVLLESHAAGVATLTLNRPESRNALSAELYDALLAALARLAADEAVGAVVLTGAGTAFCAGGDVKGMVARRPMTAAEAAADLRRRTDISRHLHEMPKPTIAAVNGPAAGAGMAIALACDLRIAGAAARFSTAFARIGLPGDFGGSYFLTRLVGPAKARELYFTAATLDAATALALGIVNRVVPDAELTPATAALATDLAAGPRAAFALMKANLNAALGGASLAAILDLEAGGTARSRESADYKEATRAFVEKRKPVFTGR